MYIILTHVPFPYVPSSFFSQFQTHISNLTLQMFTNATSEWDEPTLHSISPKSPIQVDITKTDFKHISLIDQDREWTESEDSDDSSGGELEFLDSEDADEVIVHPEDFNSSSTSTPTDQRSFHQQSLNSAFSLSDGGSSPSLSPSSDYHSARSPSPLGPSSSPRSGTSRSRSSSIVLLNQRSPSVAMRHEAALRAFRKQRQGSGDEVSFSPVVFQHPQSAPPPPPPAQQDSPDSDHSKLPSTSRPGGQVRNNSTPLLGKRRNPRPNLAPLITPGPNQLTDPGLNVEIIQDFSDDEEEELDSWQDEDGKDSLGEDQRSQSLTVQPLPPSRAAARKSLLSTLNRDSSLPSKSSTSASQPLPKPQAGTSRSSRLPSLSQISSRVASQQSETEFALKPTTPALRGRSGIPGLSTPLPAHRSFSCPTPATQQFFGLVEVLVTPPTPRIASYIGATDATMEVLRSPTNQAFAFVPAGTNEANRRSLYATGSPLLTPSWSSNGFGFGNSTPNLIPPPFEIAPGRTKKMEEQTKVMVEMMKQQMELQQGVPSSPASTLIPGSPIPPLASEAVSKLFSPRRRMASAPVSTGPKGNVKLGKPTSPSGSGSDSPNWRSKGHNSPTSPSRTSSIQSARKPAGNHSQALKGLQEREKSERIESKSQVDQNRSSPPSAARSAAGRSMLARLGQRRR